MTVVSIKCEVCNGTGRLTHWNGDYWRHWTEPCLLCSGTGIERVPQPNHEQARKGEDKK